VGQSRQSRVSELQGLDLQKAEVNVRELEADSACDQDRAAALRRMLEDGKEEVAGRS
jgi:hypothetical protein